MTLTELLNSDMATLGREARRLFDLWVEELASLVPASVKRWRSAGTRVVRFTDDGGLDAIEDAANCIVTIGHDDVLTRSITTPPLTNAELGRMLALNSERYLPLPAGSVLLATDTRNARRDDGEMIADVAAMPLPRAEALANAIVMSKITPRAVRIVDRAGQIDPRFDFLPALRMAGLIAQSDNRARNWWVAVGALAALTMGTIIWRDIADVDRLQSLVDNQRPAVGVAQRITAQMRGLDSIGRQAAERRGHSDPLTLLGLTTAAVPESAWVQRFVWNGTTLRLTGYRSQDADVAAALRKMPGVATVKSVPTDSVTEIAVGRPFDIVATMKAR